MEIKKAYCTNNSRYKAANPLNPIGVVLHSIGCPQPRATVLVNSWARNSSQYLTHFILDDSAIYQCMPLNFKCYHVGSPGNSKWLGIEMCEPAQIKYTSGATFTVSDKAAAQAYAKACYENAVQLLAKLCRDYGWNPHTAIITHGEVTRRKLSDTTHADPEHLWSGLGLAYSLETLRNDVSAAMGKTPATTKPEASENSYMLRQFIREVQEACGAAVDGIAGPETIGKTVTISATKNRRHAAVRAVQKRLASLGYSQVGEIDGIAGAKFDKAVRAYQTASGCVVDGEITAKNKTWRKLLGME